MKPIPITILREPPIKNGDYLATLEEWGELHGVVPIPNLIRLLAHLSGHNEAALRKVIVGAVARKEMRFWALSENGKWVEGDIRILPLPQGKPKINLSSGKFVQRFKDYGPLHLEAMGSRPADIVGLLVKRGRKVPDELLRFLEKPAAKHLAPEVALAKARSPTSERRTWKDVALPYVHGVFRAGQYKTAKELYKALEEQAGRNGSPFEKGAGQNKHSLYVSELSYTLALKTFQNSWAAIKAGK